MEIAVFAPKLAPERHAERYYVGSHSASREFVHAMIQFLAPDTVSLISESHARGELERALRRLGENQSDPLVVPRILDVESLSVQLATDPPSALHNLDVSMHRAAYLRSRFSSKLFPITSLSHGFSLQSLRWEYFAHLLVTPPATCDSLVCTSRAASDAFRLSLSQVAEGLAQFGVIRKDRPRIDVVPLAVDSDIYRPRDRREMRQLLGLPMDKVILLYFGRIDHGSKADIGPLLLVLGQLTRKYGDSLCLVVAGSVFPDDAPLQHVQTMATALGCGTRVIVRRAPPPAEAPLYYSAADIFVSPTDTIQESFGLAPVEAMASGLPVVVSDWSGYRETIAHGETGFLVTTYWTACDEAIRALSPVSDWWRDHLRLAQSVAIDTVELHRYLDLLISNRELRTTMGESARRHVEAHFTWGQVMRQWQGLWRELCQIAASLPPVQAAGNLIEEAPYFESYSHFATCLLSGGERLTSTERGRQVVSDSQPILLPAGMEFALDSHLLFAMLSAVKNFSRLRYSPTINEVCDKMGTRAKVSRAVMLAHLMWLLKYGFLVLIKC